MPLGFSGKILQVDLTRSTIRTEQLPETFYRRYFGGRAIVAYYLLTQMKGGEDPLGPDNVLVFAASVICGAPSHGLCRFSVGAKSPLTGGFGESEAGGFWGPELKFSGFDALVIKGKAQKPVYLWIHDGHAELRDATALWGKVTGDTQDALKKELGDPKIRVLVIGPGGENQVLYANIANDLSHMSGQG
jgi:aldehyde:ferredoxin oxidoreductase